MGALVSAAWEQRLGEPLGGSPEGPRESIFDSRIKEPWKELSKELLNYDAAKLRKELK